MASLADLSATELLNSYASGDASPVDAVKACLDRIDRIDRDVVAVMTLLADSALEQASASEQRWRKKATLPLDGVPFGLKDIIQTAGIRTTGGSRMYEQYVPPRTATVADRLLAAGGVLLAKVHTWEFATDGVPLGYTRNPWDLDRMAGGSSSGSAAAVSARELPLAIGTDTGGSNPCPGLCTADPRDEADIRARVAVRSHAALVDARSRRSYGTHCRGHRPCDGGDLRSRSARIRRRSRHQSSRIEPARNLTSPAFGSASRRTGSLTSATRRSGAPPKQRSTY